MEARFARPPGAHAVDWRTATRESASSQSARSLRIPGMIAGAPQTPHFCLGFTLGSQSACEATEPSRGTTAPTGARRLQPEWSYRTLQTLSAPPTLEELRTRTSPTVVHSERAGSYVRGDLTSSGKALRLRDGMVREVLPSVADGGSGMVLATGSTRVELNRPRLDRTHLLGRQLGFSPYAD